MSLLDTTVSEGAGVARLTAVLDAEAAVPRTFAYGTADGTALAGSDYRASTGTVTVVPGQRTATFEIAVLDDAELEGEEWFTVWLARSGTMLAEAQVTVIENDVPTVTLTGPYLAANGGHVFEHETEAAAMWTLRRPKAALGAPLTVRLTVEEHGGDFVPAPGEGLRTVEFLPTQTAVMFTPVVDDDTDDAHGTVTVRLEPDTGYLLGSPEFVETVVAVRDDDGRLVSMRLEPAALTVREGAAAEVTVIAETLPREATTFTGPGDLGRVLGRGVFLKATTMTTNVDTDAADLDHLAEGDFETLQFPDFWETADGGLAIGRAVRVQTHADTVSDDGEQFGIHLSVLADDTLGGRVVVGEPSQSVVTIREGGATLALVFSPDTIAEGRTSEVTATVDTARDAAWTVAVSARSADDTRWGFADGNRTLSFAAHATASTGAVTIRALPNERNEADLDVTVRGSPAAATGLAAVERVLTVADDDPEELHYSEVYGRIPADIGPGDSFRLLGIVGNTAATSTDLRTYDAVAKAGVRNGFDDEPSASKLGGGFTYTEGHRALVSTPDVDARTHTGTAYTATDRGVPIYWWSAILNGSRPTRRVANDYADFYDGAWPTEQDREAARQPWTGSAADGTARPGHALGAAEVGTGGIGAAAGGPLDGAPAANTEMRPVYALSQVYRVVDAPEDPPLTHPRVLLDTTLTIGAYDASGDGVADRWGYANPFLQPRNIPEHPRTTAVSAGRLGGDQWLVASLPATLYRLLWRAQTEPLAGVTEQASGGGFEYHALPLVPWDGSFKHGIGGRSGLELGTGSTAVLIEQFGADNRLTPTSRRWLHDALSGWRHAVGRTVSLRVLNLANADIWTAVLSPARSAGGAVGFVAGAVGAVSLPTFFWNGVEYRVDRLVFDASSARGLQFATTPSLPDGLRLAVPDQPDNGGAFGSPVYYYPLQAGARSTAPGVDFEWASARTAWAGAGNTSPLTVYLTQAPGAPRVKRELWTGDLTAGSAPFTGRLGSLEGYWDAAVELPAAVEGSGAVGMLTPRTAEIDGVTYTVDGLARVSGSPLWLHTTPDLPVGRGLVLEVEAGRGVVPLAIDSARARAHGYEWEFFFNEYAGDTPWAGDGDVTPDARRVRLVRWGSPGGALRASVTPSYAREGAAAVPAVTVTADLEGLAPDVDTPVTVTFGAADDSAAPTADYDPVTVPTLTVPAGQRSASVTVNIPITDDAAAELIEHATVGIAADGRAPHATEFAITDDDHEQIEYWSATLTGARTALRGRTVAGYLAEPGSAAAPVGALDPDAFRCCAGRQRDDARRSVWALGQIGDDFVLGMSGLVRNGAVAPEFRGATVRIGDRLLAPERARVVEPLPGTPALAWDADLVDAPPGSAVEVRLSGPDHPVLQEATVVSMPSGGSADQRRYGDGEVIDLSLRFDEPVEVTGTPVLALTVGTERREAAYAYGSGTRELVFAYVVRGGDVDDDGIDAGSVADALSLPSGAAIASSRYGFAPVYGDVRVSTATAHPVDGDRAKPASPSLTVHDVEVPENAGTATLTAALSFASDTPVTMDWATADRTAQAPGDYTRVVPQTLTVPADARFATLTVAIRDDAESEEDERFAVVFSNANVPLARDEAQVTIRDDETMVVSIAPPTLATNGGHVFEHEAAEAGGTAATHWVLTRAGPTAAALRVDVRASETGGGDFVGTETASVTFAAGADRAFYSPVANDATDEGHGTVTVTVQPREDAYEAAPGNASAAAAVRDDDGTLLTVEIEAEAAAVEGAPAVFDVRAENTDGTLTEAGDLERLFGVTTVAVTASTADGTATAGSDYTALTNAPASIGTFESQSGGASWVGRVSVETLDDAPLVDLGETFTVTLSLPASTDPRIALSATEATGTATFVEGSVLTLSATPSELAEGATATVTASVDPTHDAQFTVTVAGTSEDDARWEFVGGATTLTFAADQAVATGSVSIRAILNDVDEVDLAVELTATPSVATVVAGAPVVLTVLDDDLPRVSIAAPGIARDTDHLFEHEASGNKWELTRAGLTEDTLTVDLSVSDTGAFTVAGAAATAVFSAGMDTTSYTPITNDDDDELHGTVTVTVDPGTDYAVDPDAASAEVDVRDDDGTLLEVSIDAAVTAPEGMAAVFGAKAENSDGTLTAVGDLARLFGLTAVAVTAQSDDGTATVADSDYTAFDGPVALDTFEAVPGTPGGGRWTGNVSVQTTEDMVTEGSQDFTLTLSLPAGTDERIVLESGGGTGTATILEGPSVTLTLSDDELDEGETATVTATVDPVHDMAFTVTLAAESNADRIEFPEGTTFTFAASATTASATLTVEAVDNDVDDGDVTIELTATPSDAAVTAPAVELTVVDDDLPQVSIAAPAGATDDFLYEFEAATDEAQYRWSLTRAGLTDAELTVDVSVAETGGGDFAADVMESVTFEAGESTAAYTPITAADTVDDTHGTVTVTVDSGTGYAVDPDAASAALDVRDDDGDLVTVTLEPATLRVIEGRSAQLRAAAETEEGTFDTAAHMARLFGTVTRAQAIASTEASTGDGAATAGTDYTALAAATVELPFADFAGGGGVLRSRVALPEIATADDEVDDADETFKVKLAAPADQDARIAVSTTAATVTLSEGSLLRLCRTVDDVLKCTEQDKTTDADRLTEGRVEIQNDDGEWSTVCDDYWSNDDGNVVCRQMGYAGAERVFWNSHFGGAGKKFKTLLDDASCVGNEKDLLDCRNHDGDDLADVIGDHNCNVGGRHTEDAGVRCLAAETAAHGAKLNPNTLTIRAGGASARYWVSLTKPPYSTETVNEEDVLIPHNVGIKPEPDKGLTVAISGGAGSHLEFATQGPESDTAAGFYGWSYAEDADVSASKDTQPGEYKVEHAVRRPADALDFGFKVPDLTVTVTAAASSGPAPVSATVSGRDASVRFDAPLDASFAPSTSDFAVLADGRRLALTGAWTAGRALLLELAEPATGAVRLAYVPSAAAPLGGLDGSAVAPFEALALAAPGELADDAPDALAPDAPKLPAADAEPKLEGAPGLEAALADALRHAPGPVAATLAAPRRAVADLWGLGAVPELRRVNLAGNAVTDAGPLALLADLERLDLSDNAVQDLWPLSGLAELRVLDLSGNRVTDVTALAGLPRLRVLELSGNAVEDLWPLGALPNLEYLGLSGNRVTDVTALADLHALARLDLDGNAVFDATPLGDVGRLVWLKLSGNRLATLEGLGRLTKLRWVWVADNPLPDGTTIAWPERAWVDVVHAR